MEGIALKRAVQEQKKTVPFFSHNAALKLLTSTLVVNEVLTLSDKLCYEAVIDDIAKHASPAVAMSYDVLLRKNLATLPKGSDKFQNSLRKWNDDIYRYTTIEMEKQKKELQADKDAKANAKATGAPPPRRDNPPPRRDDNRDDRRNDNRNDRERDDRRGGGRGGPKVGAPGPDHFSTHIQKRQRSPKDKMVSSSGLVVTTKLTKTPDVMPELPRHRWILPAGQEAGRQKGVWQSIADGLSPKEHIAAAIGFTLSSGERWTAAAVPSTALEAADRSGSMSTTERKAFRTSAISTWRGRKADIMAGPHGKDKESVHAELLHQMLVEAELCPEGHEPKLIQHLRSGSTFPMSGPQGYPELYPTVPEEELFSKKPAMSVEELLRCQPKIKAKAEKAMRKDSPENLELIWSSLANEVEQGWAEEIPIELLNDEECIFYRTFIAMQLKADKEGWIFSPRRIDDGRAAGMNEISCMTCQLKVSTLDTFAAISNRFIQARLSSSAAPDELNFKIVKVDHKAAYRQLRADNSEFLRVILAICPTTGRLHAFLASRLLFGEKLSPLHYNAWALTLCLVTNCLLGVPLCQYYDDYATPGEADDDTLLQDLLIFLGEILESAFAEDKSDDGFEVGHLGAMVTLTTKGTTFRISKNRREKLVFYLTKIIKEDSLTVGEAASMAGRLSFASSTLWGRVGRAMIYPIYRRAAAKNLPAHAKLNAELRAAVLWWLEFLDGAEAQTHHFRRLSPVVASSRRKRAIYTDACLTGVGAIDIDLTDPGNPHFTEFRNTRDSFTPRAGLSSSSEDDIAVLEIGVPRRTLESLYSVLPHRVAGDCVNDEVVLFVDNTVAQGCLCRGSGRRGGKWSDALSKEAHKFWLFVARSGLFVWLERVESSSNPSDMPSRGQWFLPEKSNVTRRWF